MLISGYIEKALAKIDLYLNYRNSTFEKILKVEIQENIEKSLLNTLKRCQDDNISIKQVIRHGERQVRRD